MSYYYVVVVIFVAVTFSMTFRIIDARLQFVTFQNILQIVILLYDFVNSVVLKKQ